MRIDIGATVRTQEGDEVGKVERVILDPTTRDANALVVHMGTILSHDVVVPISLVQQADQGQVQLRIGKDRVSELPAFVDKHYVVRPQEAGPPHGYAPGSILFPLAPPYGIPGVPGAYETPEEEREAAPLEVDISEGMEVRTVDGPIGVVDEVLTDAMSDRISAITIKKGAILKKDITIPIEFVSKITPDHVQLSLTNQQVEELPLPVTDRYITSEGQGEKGTEG